MTACAKIEVRWTFVHFDERPLSRRMTRSKSAPSGVFVESIVQNAAATGVARSLEKRAKQKSKRVRNSKLETKKRQRQEEDDTLREYRQIAEQEQRELQAAQRWESLTTKILETDNDLLRREVAQRRRELSKLKQQLRVTLPLKVFAGVCCVMMIDRESISLLTAAGNLRENGDDVEIWSQGDEAGAVSYLVDEAMICRTAYDKGDLIVVLAATRVRFPMVFKFKGDLTVEDLVERVNARLGPPRRGQVLKHFDDLLSEGSLSENNVGPGSYVLLTRF